MSWDEGATRPSDFKCAGRHEQLQREADAEYADLSVVSLEQLDREMYAREGSKYNGYKKKGSNAMGL